MHQRTDQLPQPRRLTSLDEHCHHPYFYSRCFTPEGDRALVVARIDGVAHVRLVDVQTGQADPLVTGRGIEEYMLTLSRDGRFLYYTQDQRLHRFTLTTGEDEVVWEQQPPWDGQTVYPGFSDDDRYVALAQLHRDDAVPTTEGWASTYEQWKARPRCRIVRLNLETGQQVVCHEQRYFLGHPQLRPGDPDTVMFCHEGGGREIDARVWLVQSDGSRLRCMGYHEPTPGAGAPALITHECFMPDGQRIVYLKMPDQKGEPVQVHLRRVDDLKLTAEFTVSGYLHVAPAPDGRRLVGDQRASETELNLLWLLDIETGTERPLCVHGSSYAIRRPKLPSANTTQDAHPHAVFSPCGRRVLFTSDRETGPEGHCAVYVVNTDGA